MKLVMTVMPTGGVILSSEGPLSPQVAEHIRDAFQTWRETPEGVLVISECRVQHATSVDIDLPDPAPA